MANRELYKRIEAVYHENRGVYGSPRIYRELKDQGVACSETLAAARSADDRVARLIVYAA
jgi:hypothetical protein